MDLAIDRNSCIIMQESDEARGNSNSEGGNSKMEEEDDYEDEDEDTPLRSRPQCVVQ